MTKPERCTTAKSRTAYSPRTLMLFLGLGLSMFAMRYMKMPFHTLTWHHGCNQTKLNGNLWLQAAIGRSFHGDNIIIHKQWNTHFHLAGIVDMQFGIHLRLEIRICRNRTALVCTPVWHFDDKWQTLESSLKSKLTPYSQHFTSCIWWNLQQGNNEMGWKGFF